LKISDLKGSPDNPRVMKEKAQKGLNKSVKTFGDLSGITFNETTGNLVTGHHRMIGLESTYGDQLKIEPIEGSKDHWIVTPDGERFRVRVVAWDKTKEMAANITANNSAIQGQFNDKLQPLLWKIKDELNQKFSELKLDALIKHGKTRIGQAEEEFSEVLNEANNYVVLFFKNSVDWMSALSHFDLETKTSTRANGKEWSKGIGRVLDGATYLKKLTSKQMGE
jgi:hypothetical protein